MNVQQQQLLNLFLLLVLGAFFSNLYLLWYEVLGVLVFTFLFDMFVVRWQLPPTDTKLFEVFVASAEANPTATKLFDYCRVGFSRRYFPYSSLATSIGVMLMMVSTHFYIYLIVIALAVLQKHYLKINKQHFFNPSNFALIIGLFLFYDDAHIVLGQLGDETWLGLLLGVLGMAILIRVNRWIIPISFIFFYLVFQYLFVVSLDPVLIMEEVYYRFYSVSFILFILFMLTDPKTTPSKNYEQIGFAFLVAFFSVGLDYIYGFRIQHLFLSLFFFSLFTPMVEHWNNRSKALVLSTFLLFVLATMVIINIESQAPYYFTMDG